jgi:hypothetical protein
MIYAKMSESQKDKLLEGLLTKMTEQSKDNPDQTIVDQLSAILISEAKGGGVKKPEELKNLYEKLTTKQQEELNAKLEDKNDALGVLNELKGGTTSNKI